MTERRGLVRRFFDRADNHRAAAHVTRLRAHVVRQLLGDVAGLSILDAGAGDGAVTLDLAATAARLTWLDISAGMLAAARATIVPQLASRIRIVEGDLATHEGLFDIVVCVGVLAHVDDVTTTMEKIAALTAPRGRLVIELEDHASLAALPLRIAHRLREAGAPRYGYALNSLRLDDIDALAASHGLRRVDQRRYWSTPPLMRRLTSPITQSTFERATLDSPFLSKLGSSVIALYAKS